MKPVSEMTDDEVIEELSAYKSSVEIDLADIKKARHMLHLLRTTFDIEEDDDEENDI